MIRHVVQDHFGSGTYTFQPATFFRPGLAKMSSAASSLKRGRAIDIDFDAGEKTILSADALKVADAVCYVVLF